jgi:hypothetical protein
MIRGRELRTAFGHRANVIGDAGPHLLPRLNASTVLGIEATIEPLPTPGEAL